MEDVWGFVWESGQGMSIAPCERGVRDRAFGFGFGWVCRSFGLRLGSWVMARVAGAGLELERCPAKKSRRFSLFFSFFELLDLLDRSVKKYQSVMTFTPCFNHNFFITFSCIFVLFSFFACSASR